ncbi:MAG: CRISPR-associated protein Csx15, partial [Dethiobacteria bacterium]
HPLTNEQLQEIKALTKTKITAILDINSQISAEKPLAPQIEKMLDSTGLSSQEWQTSTLLINLPSLNYSAATLLAQLHGRMGYFPPVLRLQPLTEKIPLRYAVTEILNLQAIREHARKKR